MKIFLAEVSKERGQYESLVGENYCQHLVSYAYRNPAISAFKRIWDEQVKLYFAGVGPFVVDAKVEENANNYLGSYTYQKELKDNFEAYTAAKRLPDVIVDSGAFTAWNCGKPIEPQDFGEWALGVKEKWGDRLGRLTFMNLDVIGDQEATWINQAILEGMGLQPLPIVTYGSEPKHLLKALDEYEYIALGGLVPYVRQRQKLQWWLDRCFHYIMQDYKKRGQMRRIHLLGITTEWVLHRYPMYSSDSSSWVSCLRFGGGAAAGIKQLPRYKESDGALSATLHTLRHELRRFKRMEAETTKLWARRGIEWGDR